MPHYYVASQRIQDFLIFFFNKNEVFGGELEIEPICVRRKTSVLNLAAMFMRFPTMRKPNVRPAKGSDQPAHMRAPIRAFASRLNIP